MLRTKRSIHIDAGIEQNPFSVNYVQPGTIPYFFETPFIEKIRNESPLFFTQAYVESFRTHTELTTWVGCCYLADLFAKKGYRGQITGPHGSGKSTLTSFLTRVLEESGISVFYLALHDKTRKIPAQFYESIPLNDPKKTSERVQTVLIIDGYEQLNWLQRRKLRHFCTSRHYGLLITSHTRKLFFGRPLYRTSPSEKTLRKIVDYLLDDAKVLPSDRLLATLSAKHKKNFRGILFDLYDWYRPDTAG